MNRGAQKADLLLECLQGGLDSSSASYSPCSWRRKREKGRQAKTTAMVIVVFSTVQEVGKVAIAATTIIVASSLKTGFIHVPPAGVAAVMGGMTILSTISPLPGPASQVP